MVGIMSLLMIAFMIQPALNLFMPSPGKSVIGRLPGQKITAFDRDLAAREMLLLANFDPRLAEIANDQPERWILALYDATENLKLDASNAEADTAIRSLPGVGEEGWATPEARKATAGRMGTDANSLREAIRHLILYYRYHEVVSGNARTDSGAQPSTSEPLLRHLAHEALPMVSGRVYLIEAEDFINADEPVDDAVAQALFETYSDTLPGEGEYGLGYRYPDRVQIEYLALPMDLVLDNAELVTPASDYFAQHPDKLVGVPYEQRHQRIEQLRQQDAIAECRKVMAHLQTRLAQERASLQQELGYYVIDGDTPAPLSFTELADDVEERFGVRPVMTTENDPTGWINVSDLSDLESLRFAYTPDNPPAAASDLVATTQAFAPPVGNLLATRYRTQIGIASDTLTLYDNSPYVTIQFGQMPGIKGLVIFRLIDVEASHAPASFDVDEALAQQVRQDVRLIAAYEQLVADLDSTWQARLDDEGFDTLAESRETVPAPILQLRRRELIRSADGSSFVVPDVTLVGQDADFVDQLFDLIEANLDVDLSETPLTTLVAVPGRQALAIVELDEYQGLTQSNYDLLHLSPQSMQALADTLIDEPGSPLSMETLVARTGYKAEEGRNDEASDD